MTNYQVKSNHKQWRISMTINFKNYIFFFIKSVDSKDLMTFDNFIKAIMRIL